MADNQLLKIIDSINKISPGLGTSLETAIELIPYAGTFLSIVKYSIRD